MQFYNSATPPNENGGTSTWKDEIYLAKGYKNNYYEGLKFEIPVTV
jgi:hypothetical protein